MNTFLFIFTALVVLAGSALGLIAPIWKKQENRFRIAAACLTVTGGSIGIWFGLRSAFKTDALMQSTSQILQTSKEASFYASGGDAYPEVFSEAVTREDGTRQIGFYLTKQGKYPLYGLQVIVGKPFKASASDPTIQTFGTSRQFQELDANASYPIWFQPIPQENSTIYSAIMSARNGNWEEVINVQKVSSGIAFRWILFRSSDPRVSPNEQVFDLADEIFPRSERKRKIYPLNGLTLPVAPHP